MRRWSCQGVRLLVGAVVLGGCALGLTTADEPAAPPAQFEKPVRLKAGDAFIDTGAAWGHASPWVADVDGDGKRDLLVGDFSGKFRLFVNTGTNEQPVYRSAGFLQAGGVDAHVPIY